MSKHLTRPGNGSLCYLNHFADLWGVCGVLKKGEVRLGIAPIAWTNDDMPELGGEISFEQCIDEMAKAGFEGSEVGNKYPRDPEVLAEALEPRKHMMRSSSTEIFSMPWGQR